MFSLLASKLNEQKPDLTLLTVTFIWIFVIRQVKLTAGLNGRRPMSRVTQSDDIGPDIHLAVPAR